MTQTEKKISQILELGSQRKFLEAQKLCEEILALDEKNSQVLTLFGLLKYENKEIQQGIELIEKALEINPNPKLYMDLARIYANENNLQKSIECYKNSALMDCANFDAWFCLAFSLKNNGQIDEAIDAYKQAAMINPLAEEVYHNLTNIYQNIKNNPQMAKTYCLKYLEIHPEDEDAKSNLGALYLKMKNYKLGWQFLQFSPNIKRAISDRTSENGSQAKFKPIWQGEELADKTIYVYFEAGLGDTIMFSRFLPELKNRAKKVLFRPQNDLVCLFKNCKTFDGIEILSPKILDKELEFDFHTPLMSLAHFFNIEEKDIPFSNGYFKANKEKINDYKEKHFNIDKFKIGINWKGSIAVDTTRKIPSDYFYRLAEKFKGKDVQFYSLQKPQTGEDELAILKMNGVEVKDLNPTFNDFSDTAAAIENLDLVITNDTSIAHLAGALGKKCFVLLPFVQDWRWSEDTSYCPWYKNTKLFKQIEKDNWSEVFERVEKELNNKNSD